MQLRCPLPGSQHPAEQESFAQHGCPGRPHCTHASARQIVPIAEQTPPQHGCPAAPQFAQTPLVHCPRLLPQDCMFLIQASPTQHPSSLHAAPAQQISPAPPHGAHAPIPGPLQTAPAGEQDRFAQQSIPRPPHGAQTLVSHTLPGPQVPPQQGCPTAPQMTLRSALLLRSGAARSPCAIARSSTEADRSTGGEAISPGPPDRSRAGREPSTSVLCASPPEGRGVPPHPASHSKVQHATTRPSRTTSRRSATLTGRRASRS